MLDEKPEPAAQAAGEGDARDQGVATVIDFLWSTEVCEGADAARPEVSADAASAEGLQQALARYSSWLNRWAKGGSHDATDVTE